MAEDGVMTSGYCTEYAWHRYNYAIEYVKMRWFGRLYRHLIVFFLYLSTLCFFGVKHLPGHRALRSAGTNCLSVPSIRLCTVSTDGSWAFPVACPWIWNALPQETTSAQSLSLFPQRLKSHLFRQSYPDLIIWCFVLSDCFLLQSNLEVALVLRPYWLIDWLTPLKTKWPLSGISTLFYLK